MRRFISKLLPGIFSSILTQNAVHVHIDHVSIVIYEILVESMTFGFGELLRKLWLYIVNFNIFSSIPPTEDQHELRNQRISTRLFIVLFALSLTILMRYISLKRSMSTRQP